MKAIRPKIRFVENKSPDMGRIASLLDLCKKQNMWANRGPVYKMLIERYSAYFRLDETRSVVPCANAGVALEAMSRLLGKQSGRPLRWVGSAFSFQNLGRGHFADMKFVDCTPGGMLDLDEVRNLPADSFDGLIVVNPFGLYSDFAEYFEYARRTGKALLLDNAAGVHDTIPDWPWQAFSLHQTKPYGMGEGGMALVPSDCVEELYGLLNYGEEPHPPGAWLNNGKLSDISCAFLIDRLEKADDWVPRYLEQADRVNRIAGEAGLTPICPYGPTAPAMSWAFSADAEIPLASIHAACHLNFAKYYKPLRSLPRTNARYARTLNIPTHPDVARLKDGELREDIDRILSACHS